MGGGQSKYKPWPDLDLFSQDVKNLRDKVLDPVLHGRKKYNILLVGKQGVGKSSLANSIVTVADNDLERIKYPSEMKQYPIGKHIVLHDMPGYNEKEIADGKINLDTIKYILDGKAEDKENLRDNPIDPSRKGDEDRKIDAVMLVLDPMLEQKEHNKLASFYNDLFKACSDRKIRMTVVMTKVDRLCSLTRSNIMKAHNSNDVYKTVDFFVELTGLNSNFILPAKNYTNEHKRVPGMDLLLLHALDVTLALAVDQAEGDRAVEY